MNQLKVGIIGVGFMGKMHASVFKSLPFTQLVGVADSNEKRLQDPFFAGIKTFSNYKELLSEDIDVVSICVSDRFHFEPTMAAIKANKHIFLEKPLTLSISEAEEILSAVEQYDKKFTIGYLLRFDPRYGRVKESIDSGALGDIVFIHARRNSTKDEGPARYHGTTPLVYHVTVHDIDLVLWYLSGKKPVTVYAQKVSKTLSSMKMDDAIFSIVRFDDGTVVNFESSWALPEGSTTKLDAYMEICGTKAMAKVDCGQSLIFFDSTSTATPDMFSWPVLRNEVMGDLREELSHFVRCIIEDKEPIVSVQDGLESLRLAIAMDHSADTNEIVVLS